MIRKQIVVGIIALSAAAGFAQTVTHQPIASQYGQWTVLGSQNLAASANPLVSFTPCAISAGATQFNAIAASTPIKIYDPGNPSVDEVVTPTAVVVNSNGCTATITPSNAHTQPWYIGSGSYGLQEAINANTLTGQVNTVVLDSAWHAAGGGAAQIQNATGTGTLSLLDVSAAPNISYKWTGTHYQPIYSLNGIGNPTIAAGAAAGSSPTVANVAASSGNSITANVTTGTATTTGTLFTETVGTAAAQNLVCTVRSVGANIPTAFTWTSASTTILTVTVASAPAVSTAYVFNIQCL